MGDESEIKIRITSTADTAGFTAATEAAEKTKTAAQKATTQTGPAKAGGPGTAAPAQAPGRAAATAAAVAGGAAAGSAAASAPSTPAEVVARINRQTALLNERELEQSGHTKEARLMAAQRQREEGMAGLGEIADPALKKQASDNVEREYEQTRKEINEKAALAKATEGVAKQGGNATGRMMMMEHVMRSMTDASAAGISPLRALGMEAGRIGPMLGLGLGPILGLAGMAAGIGFAGSALGQLNQVQQTQSESHSPGSGEFKSPSTLKADSEAAHKARDEATKHIQNWFMAAMGDMVENLTHTKGDRAASGLIGGALQWLRGDKRETAMRTSNQVEAEARGDYHQYMMDSTAKRKGELEEREARMHGHAAKADLMRADREHKVALGTLKDIDDPEARKAAKANMDKEYELDKREVGLRAAQAFAGKVNSRTSGRDAAKLGRMAEAAMGGGSSRENDHLAKAMRINNDWLARIHGSVERGATF